MLDSSELLDEFGISESRSRAVVRGSGHMRSSETNFQ